MTFKFTEEYDKATVIPTVLEIPVNDCLSRLMTAFASRTQGDSICKSVNLSRPFSNCFLEFTRDKTNLTIFELVKKPGNENEYELQAKVNKTFALALDSTSMSRMQHAVDCLVLPTIDGKAIHVISIEDPENISARKLFDLPAAVTNVNQVSFNSKLDFVLVNTNLGELHLWSKTQEDPVCYKAIYRKELPEKSALIRLTEDLKYVFTVTKHYFYMMPFSPFRSDNSFSAYEVPWVKNLITKDQDFRPQSLKEPLLFYPFNNGNALLYIHPKKMFVYNILDMKATILELNNLGYKPSRDSLKGAEVITVKDRLQWLFYLTCEEESPPEEISEDEDNTRSHFLAFTVWFDVVGQKYQIDKILDVTINGTLYYLHHQNVVILENTSKSRCMLIKFLTEPKLKGLVFYDTSEFSLSFKLGIHSLKPEQPLDPVLAFLNSELGIIIRKPEELLDSLQEISQPVGNAFSVASKKQNQVAAVSTAPLVNSQSLRRLAVRKLQPTRTEPAPGLNSDVDSEVEAGSQWSQPQQAEHVTLSGTKAHVGEDHNPDHDSMDEHFVKLENKSSHNYNKRPPPGSYEVFSLADLMVQNNERVKVLGTGKIHCSGASFVKTSPCSGVTCIYGKSGFEIFKVKIKTISKEPFQVDADKRKEAELEHLSRPQTSYTNHEQSPPEGCKY